MILVLLLVVLIAVAALVGGIGLMAYLIDRAWWRGRNHQLEIDRVAMDELRARPKIIERNIEDRLSKTRMSRPGDPTRRGMTPPPPSIEALPSFEPVEVEVDLSGLDVVPRVESSSDHRKRGPK